MLDANTEAAYHYVESVLHTADDPVGIMWHGWALREAYAAGAKWKDGQLKAEMTRQKTAAYKLAMILHQLHPLLSTEQWLEWGDV